MVLREKQCVDIFHLAVLYFIISMYEKKKRGGEEMGREWCSFVDKMSDSCCDLRRGIKIIPDKGEQFNLA